MPEITNIVCDKCRNKNQYVWVKGIQYICQTCRQEINFLEAIFDGRVSTSQGVIDSGIKKKKGRR